MAWGFYGRSKELQELQDILARRRWFFVRITGRRRIGKTALVQQALARTGHGQMVYVQIPDSAPAGVLSTFRDAMDTFELSKEELARFFEVVRDFPLSQRRDRTCMYLRQMTQREVFKRVRAEQRDLEQVRFDDPEDISRRQDDLESLGHLASWPETKRYTADEVTQQAGDLELDLRPKEEELFKGTWERDLLAALDRA